MQSLNPGLPSRRVGFFCGVALSNGGIEERVVLIDADGREVASMVVAADLRIEIREVVS